MPHYEYRCLANGRTLEVRHGMDEHFETWGPLATRAGIALGRTPPDAPVERLLSAPAPLRASGADGGADDFQGCGANCACARRT